MCTTFFLLTTFPPLHLSLHLSHSDNRSHPACGGSMGEVDAGPVHLPDSGQLHQRPVCPHWHRNRHHRFWPVRMFRHLQRKPMDAEAGERLQKPLMHDKGGDCNHAISGCLTCVALRIHVLFCCLPAVCDVSLARLPRRVSGWNLRICISSRGQNTLHNLTSSARQQCCVNRSLRDRACFYAADKGNLLQDIHRRCPELQH